MTKHSQTVWFLREKSRHVVMLCLSLEGKRKDKKNVRGGMYFLSKRISHSFGCSNCLGRKRRLFVFCIAFFKIPNPCNKKLIVGIRRTGLVLFRGFIGQFWPRSPLFFIRNVSKASELMACEVLRNIPFHKSVLRGCDTNGRWPVGLWQNSPLLTPPPPPHSASFCTP